MVLLKQLRGVAIGLVAFFICSPLLVAASEASSPDETIELPGVQVLSDVLKISFYADREGLVERAEVTEVVPNSPADKRNIKTHDELVALDKVQIKGAKYGDLRDLVEGNLRPGEKRVFSFTGYRGFFSQKEIRYDFVIVGRTAP